MNDLHTCIKDLQNKFDELRRMKITETSTRIIFINPLLEALGWNVKDLSEVEHEYTVIGGKTVDYGLKINNKPVLFIEAKPLKDPLTDMKSITQVVSYAATEGVEWCILTNGYTYKVYKTTEKVSAPEKLLFEVSIKPKEHENISVNQIAHYFSRFSRYSMENGYLDRVGEEIFITGKVRKALDKIFLNPPKSFIELIRNTAKEKKIKPTHIKSALQNLWTQTSGLSSDFPQKTIEKQPANQIVGIKKGKYTEQYHILGKPQGIVELYRLLDKFCRELDPQAVKKEFMKKYIKYSYGKTIFCTLHVFQSHVKVWLKLNYQDLINPPAFVSNATIKGHWGVGDVELVFDSLENLKMIKELIIRSFEKRRTY